MQLTDTSSRPARSDAGDSPAPRPPAGPYWQKASRRPPWPIWAVAIVGGWLFLVAAGVLLDHVTGHSHNFCLLKSTTGVPCPTCGTTRAFLSLSRGDVLGAWRMNPLVMTVLLLWVLDIVIRVVFARRLRWNLSRRQRRVAWLGGVVLLLLNWAYVIVYVG